ncbi:transmembrane protein 220-like [Haliotis cracherodii]|uniref:transmembrane protein 220-like n=1 Tax=Haliotis cracherodii TaxID=6455 RepID=UPI0039E7E274
MDYERVTTSAGDTPKIQSGMWEHVWRAINIFMLLFFSLAAFYNLNDSDWYLWVPIYVIPAVLCLPIIAKPSLSENKIVGWMSVVHFTLCLAYSGYQIITMIQVISGRIENPLQHEEGREMGGLLIIIAWLGICRFTSLGRPHTTAMNRSLMNALVLMSVTLAVLPLFTWALCFVGDWHQKLGHCNGMFRP